MEEPKKFVVFEDPGRATPLPIILTQQAQAEKSTEQTTLEQLVALMLRKESKTLAKEEDTEARRIQARDDMRRSVQEAKAQEQQRQMLCERNTGHRKENGNTALAGQQHNDGLIHLFCLRCGKAMTPYVPSKEQFTNGVQLV